MSYHHPSQPPSGAMYNSNAPVAPSTTASYAGMQQYQYRPQGYSPFWQGQSFSNGMTLAQSTNGYAHGTNAQGTNPAIPSAGVVQAPYGEYANAAQYDAAPTQFHTAVPNPAYGAISYAPQPPVDSNHHVLSEQVAHYPPRPRLSPQANNMNMGKPAAAANTSPELEDGELSSGELSNSMDDLYADTAGVHERPQLEVPQSLPSELEKTSHRGSYDSIESGKPALKPSDVSTGAPTNTANPKVTGSLRQQAQAILRELHSYGISLEDIEDEVSEIDILRDLFVGMAGTVPSMGGQTQQQGVGEAADHAKAVASSTQDPNASDSQDSSSNGVLISGAATDDLGMDNAIKSSATSNPTSSTNIASNNNAGPTKDLRASTLGKIIPKSTVSKPVDRKDYIARLMAAKSGKPLPSSDAESVPQQILSDKKLPAPDAGASPRNDSQAPPENSAKDPNASSTQPSQVQDDTPNIEAKRKAQTELARQKIEALKNQKKAQLQEATPTATKVPDPYAVPTMPRIQVSTGPKSTDIQQPTQMSTPTEGRQGSYFSPVSLKPAFSIPGLFTASQDLSSQTSVKPPNVDSVAKPSQSVPSAIATSVGPEDSEGPRKRLKAADFMDSTSTSLLKALSHGEDNGVIIDISDDDADDDAEDGWSHHSIKTDQAPAANAPNSGFASENDESLNTGQSSLPSGLLASSKSTRELANGTLSHSNNAYKVQEPQDLKTKVLEIQTMNQKILELEQRIKAKQTASRAQSPRVPVASATDTSVSNRQSPRVAPQRVDTATEEQLLEEKEKQQDKLATAEAEQSRMAKTEHQEVAPEHSAFEKPFQPTEPEEGLRQASKIQQDTSQTEQQNEASANVLRQRNLLEAELLALDTDMLRSQELLVQTKLELERIENEIRHKTDRKRRIQQKLVSPPSSVQKLYEAQQQQQEEQAQPLETTDMNIETDTASMTEYTDVNGVSNLRATTKTQAIPTNLAYTSPPEPTNACPQHHNTNAIDDRDDDTVKATEQLLGLADTTHANDAQMDEEFDDLHQTFGAELEEDNMDISGSDADEGHVLKAHHNPESKSEDVMDVGDDEDIYEPPSHIDSVVDDHGPSSDRVREQPFAEVAAIALPSNQIDEAMTRGSVDASPSIRPDAEQLPNDSSAQPGTKDEDDYEPPEPESFAEATVPPLKDNATIESFLEQPVEQSDESQQPTSTTAPANGHFIPYNSPLKHFASYRFHPEYRKDVPGGFRSLTYSHDIRPEVPICQNELDGGVCNDASCTNQHFQKMALPDHLILGAMGKGEGSTPEEKDKYINGLRSLIFDLRKREIKDLDAIAEAISQYRLGFLDDTSKVLPL